MTDTWSHLYTPIAYTYDAAFHCASCTQRQFPPSWEGARDNGGLPIDKDGNTIAAVYSWDLGCKESCIDCGLALSRRCLNCSDCDMWVTGLENTARAGNTSARRMLKKLARMNTEGAR